MAAEGMRFTHAYAGATVCARSRCVLMTGLHIGHARVRGLYALACTALIFEASDVTVAEVLKDAGYATGLIGKWGLGEPTEIRRRPAVAPGLRLLLRLPDARPRSQLLPRLSVAKRIEGAAAKRSFQRPELKGLVAEKKVQYAHDLISDECAEVRSRPQGQTILLVSGIHDSARQRRSRRQGHGSARLRRVRRISIGPSPEKGHAAMISRMDDNVGRADRSA